MQTSEPFVSDQAIESKELYFPKTRFQGSKRKFVQELKSVFESYRGGSALDLYSGSGTVTLLLRELGFNVTSNDFLKYANNTASLFLTLNKKSLNGVDWEALLNRLLYECDVSSAPLVSEHYSNIFFTDDENYQIDRFCQNIDTVGSDVERMVLVYAVGQALLMKRPYNLFHRANLHMRLKDVERSFGNHATWCKPIAEHAYKAIQELRKIALIANETNHCVTNHNTNDLCVFDSVKPDVVYLDPPYIANKGQPVNYANFYNFLEGLVDYSLFKQATNSAKHRPIVDHPTNWLEPSTAEIELENIANQWPESVLIMSYRDDGKPSVGRLLEILSTNGRVAKIAKTKNYKYALSHSKSSQEVIVVVD